MRRLYFFLSLVGIIPAAYAQEDLSLAEVFNLTVTTASKRAEKITDAPSTIYVVTEQDINKYGYTELQDLLKNIPGVTNIDLSFFSFGGQRGFVGNFSQTLLLVNGREMQNLIAAETFISRQFATHNIARVEVIQGPGSALYGANALVGVINIITKNDDKNFNRAEVGIEFGSSNTMATNLVFGKTSGKTRISGSIRTFESDMFDFTDSINEADEFFDSSDPALKNMGGSNSSFRYKNKSSSLPVSLKFEYDNIYAGFEGYKVSSAKGLEKLSIDPQAQRDVRDLQLYYLGYNGELDGSSRYNIEAGLYREKFNSRNYVAPSDADTTTSDEDILKNSLIQESQENSNGSKRYNLKAQYFTEAMDSYIILGYEYNNYDIMGIQVSTYDTVPPFDNDPSETNPLRRKFYKRERHSLLAQWQKSFNQLALTVGGRFDNDENFGEVFTSRSGFVWSATDGVKLKLLYGQAFREPTIFDQGALADLQSEEIKPTKVDTVEASVNAVIGKSFFGTATIYQTVQKDPIVESGTGQFTNGDDKKTAQGGEIQLFYKQGQVGGEVIITQNSISESETFAGQDYKDLGLYTQRMTLGGSYGITNALTAAVRVNHYPAIEAKHGNSTIEEVIDIDEASIADVTLSWANLEFDQSKYTGYLVIKNASDEKWFQPNIRRSGPKKYPQAGREFLMRVSTVF